MLPVSVVIPCYNRENYIRESVESVLRQTMAAFEIIVVDDGSTDNSVDVIRSIRSKTIKVICLPRNMGISAARNAGILAAQGELIAFLDSDDIMFETRLEEQEIVFRNDHRITICGSYLSRIDEKGNFLGNTEGFHDNDRMLKLASILGCPFHFTTIMVKSKFHNDEKILFNELLEIGEDYDYMSRNVLDGHGYLIKKHLTSCREHINSKTAEVMSKIPGFHMDVFNNISLGNLRKIGFYTDEYTLVILREKLFSTKKPNYDALSEEGKSAYHKIEAHFIRTFSQWYDSHKAD